MQPVFVIIVFFILKALQYFNSFVLARFFSVKNITAMVVGIFVVSIAIYLTAFFTKRHMSEKVNRIWFIITPIIVISGFFNPMIFFTFMAGLLLYGFFAAETEVLQSITKKVPKYVLLIVSLLPLSCFWLFPQKDMIGTQIIYVFSIIFTYITSYASSLHKGEKTVIFQRGPLWLIGPIFTVTAGIVYYVLLNNTTDIMPSGITTTALLALAVMFYALGSTMIYSSIDESLSKSTVEVSDSNKTLSQ